MIANKVREILQKQYGLMRADDDMLLMLDIGMAPIEVLEMLIEIERKIGVRMPSADSLWINMERGQDMTVAQFIAFVEDHVPVHMVTAPKVSPTMDPVAGLYAITRKGTPICCVTGKRCSKLSKEQIKNNGQLANLCKAYRCEVEQNFINLAQKVK